MLWGMPGKFEELNCVAHSNVRVFRQLTSVRVLLETLGKFKGACQMATISKARKQNRTFTNSSIGRSKIQKYHVPNLCTVK